MQKDVFYLHEDDWAMIDLLPAENFTELLRIAHQAQVFGEEHFDGYGWMAMYKIPRPTYPLSLRALPFPINQPHKPFYNESNTITDISVTVKGCGHEFLKLVELCSKIL